MSDDPELDKIDAENAPKTYRTFLHKKTKNLGVVCIDPYCENNKVFHRHTTSEQRFK